MKYCVIHRIFILSLLYLYTILTTAVPDKPPPQLSINARMSQGSSNHRSPASRIIILRLQHFSIIDQHIEAAPRIQVPPCQMLWVSHNLGRIILARPIHTLTSPIIIKERPKARAIDVDIRAADYALVPCHAAVCIGCIFA
jgi:hypothetical protein